MTTQSKCRIRIKKNNIYFQISLHVGQKKIRDVTSYSTNTSKTYECKWVWLWKDKIKYHCSGLSGT